MTVLEKKTLRPVEVYDIRYDRKGFPTFLYYQNGQWLQKSAKHFTPNYDVNWVRGGYRITDDESDY